MERLLARLASACAAAPWPVLGVALLAVAAGLWVTVTRLEFHGSRDDIATATAVPHTARYLQHAREFPDDASVVVVIDGRDRARAEAFAERLASRLAGRPELRQVFYRIDPAALGGRALLYLPADTLAQVRDGLVQGRRVLAEVAEHPGLVTFVEAVNRDVTRRLGEFAAGDLLGPAPTGRDGIDDGALDGGALAAFARALARTVDGGPLPSLADTAPALPFAERRGTVDGAASLVRPRYLSSDNGRFLFVLVTPAAADVAHRPLFDGKATADDAGGAAVAVVRAAVAETRRAFPGLEVGVTGPEALSADERASTRRDVGLAVTLGFLGNVLILIAFFRSPTRSACVLLCLGAALAWSFGFVTLAIGHLNMLSAVFASILIGVGINFPIHLLARYEEAEREGHPQTTAIRLMVVRTGGTVAVSALVLIAAALALTDADLPAIAELGIISAAGLTLSLLATYTVFPSLMALVGRRSAPAAPGLRGGRTTARLAARLGRTRWPLAAGLLLALAGGGLTLWRPPAFDSNLLNLQAPTSESVRYERALIAEGGAITWFVVTDAADLAEARRKTEALAARPLVDRVESVLDLIPPEQPAKGRILREIRPLVADIGVRRNAAPAFALEPFRSAVSRLAFKLGAAPGTRTADARRALVELLAAIDRTGAPVAERRLAAAQAALVDDFADGLAFLKANLESTALTVDTLPEELRARSVGRSGRLLIRIYPKENTWEREALARFLADVRTVEPGVTGPRVQGFEVTETIRRDYARTSAVAIGVIALLAAATFRNLTDALLSVIPLGVGGLWTAGAMAALRLDFNLANLFALPLIIGLAVDAGMNLVGRAREEPAEAEAILGRSVGKSVLLATLTTIAGFGALLPAHHRGIVSLGLLLCLGTALTALAAFVVLPPALGAVRRRRAAARRAGLPAAPLFLAVATGAGLLGATAGGVAAAAQPAGAVDAVRATIEAARTIMRDPALERSAREERIRRLITERFDTQAMARAALGPHAGRLTPAQWREYAALFDELFARSYSRMVLSFLESVEVRYGDAEPAGGGADTVLVRTTLLRSQGETLPVDYRLRPQPAGWAFTDVVIDGLSLVGSYRSQFDRVLRNDGPAALLERMRSRRDR